MKSALFELALVFTFACAAPAAAAPLPSLPAAASTFTSGSLRVDVYGTPNKPVLIFIPGLACGPWEWAGEIRQLTPDYTIYALTLPGFDGQPPIQSPLFQTVAEDFWKMLHDRNIQEPVLIGHSLGGTTSIMLAEQHSELLRAVIALDGLPIFPGFENLPPAQRASIAQQASAGLAYITSPQEFESAEKTYALNRMITSKADINAAAALAARSDPKASGQWLQEDMTTDLRPQLGAISIPFLEIAPFDAAFDPMGPAKIPTSAAKQAYYASLLSGDKTAQVKIVEPSRHFAMYDQPQQLHALIATFLQTLPSR